eukprot:TRINITY_DN42966_c0_g1_i1.p3 TRINITY_DN42966_c0_g1~~TRINITY_DN42966_c0_g1_i1.p3  ORF type:complete len:119 (+),score=15.30 TRINITY_DN42966_c0_g1_i1:1387-1743(+)
MASWEGQRIVKVWKQNQENIKLVGELLVDEVLKGIIVCPGEELLLLLTVSSVEVWKIKELEIQYKLMHYFSAVSYTHLTLPTKRIVQISVVAVSSKKKNDKITLQARVNKCRERTRTT